MVMLQLSSAINNRPILSLRSGASIAKTQHIIINPDNLKILGFEVSNYTVAGDHVLPVSEVREIISKGLVVNDHESITPENDMVRIKDIINQKFEVLGKKVVAENGVKIGKVVDFCFDPASFFIVQLFVSPSLLKGINASQRIIKRDDIVELTDKTIVIKNDTERRKAPEPATANA